MAQLQSELATARVQVATHKDRVECVQVALGKKEVELERAASQLAEAAVALRELKSNKALEAENVEALEATYAAANEELKSTVQALTERCETLAIEVAQSKLEVATQRSSCAQAQQDWEQSEQANKTLQQMLAEANAKLITQMKEGLAIVETRNAMKGDLAASQATVVTAQQEVTQAHVQIQQLEAQLTSTTAAMTAQQLQTTQRIETLEAELIESGEQLLAALQEDHTASTQVSTLQVLSSYALLSCRLLFSLAA